MNMKRLFFSVLLASAVMPAANAYESNERRLTVEDVADLTQGMTKESVHGRIGKPVMRTAGVKDTWIYKAIANTSHGVDVCNVSVGFDRNGLLERASWDEKSCDNSTLSQLTPKNSAYAPAPTYTPGIDNMNYPAYDGMLAPKAPRTLAVLDYDYPKIQPPAPQPKPPVADFTLSSDVLFAFDSYKLKPEAHAELSRRWMEAEAITPSFKITILGHTDRIGKASYNKDLSDRRAMAVGLFYVNKFGANPDDIFVEGFGSTQPVKECGNLPRKQLIDCLQPNRRVQVIFQE